MEILTSAALRNYRRHALLAITVISAVITPPDVMTCLLVMGPLYLLYECSIGVVAFVERRKRLLEV